MVLVTLEHIQLAGLTLDTYTYVIEEIQKEATKRMGIGKTE